MLSRKSTDVSSSQTAGDTVGWFQKCEDWFFLNELEARVSVVTCSSYRDGTDRFVCVCLGVGNGSWSVWNANQLQLSLCCTVLSFYLSLSLSHTYTHISVKLNKNFDSKYILFLSSSCMFFKFEKFWYLRSSFTSEQD